MFLRSRSTKKQPCPKCSQFAGIRIHFGALNPKSARQIMRGEVKFGGSEIPESAPNRYCKSCKHTWKFVKEFEVEQ